jgi:hypothetical protein
VDVTTALLCDHAQVREGLLFVLSGGITRLRRPAYPAQLGVGLALVLEFDRIEDEHSHEFAVVVVGEDGEEVGRVAADIQVGEPEGSYVGENVQVPLAIDMHGALLPKPGPYQLHVYLDGAHRRTLQFWAEATGELLA